MNSYTVHVRAERPPVLVKEAFAWGALLFGPFWLLLHRAWLAAIAAFVVFAAILLVPSPERGLPMAAAMILMGLLGRDLRRWSLERRGYALAAVVAARDGDAAFLRYSDTREGVAA